MKRVVEKNVQNTRWYIGRGKNRGNKFIYIFFFPFLLYLFIFFFFTTKYLDLSPINFSPNNTAICSFVAIIETSFHPRFWKKRTDSRNDLRMSRVEGKLSK